MEEGVDAVPGAGAAGAALGVGCGGGQRPPLAAAAVRGFAAAVFRPLAAAGLPDSVIAPPPTVADASLLESQQPPVGGAAAAPSGDVAMYVLNIGVAAAHRRRGVARAMWACVLARAAEEPRCRAVYLHVSAGMPGALALYERLGLSPVRRLPGHYTYDGAGADDADARVDAIVMAGPAGPAAAGDARGATAGARARGAPATALAAPDGRSPAWLVAGVLALTAVVIGWEMLRARGGGVALS